MAAKHSALLLIDPQNDFCDPMGSLFVPGADSDMVRIASLIRLKGQLFDRIYITLDTHVRLAIFHPLWFQDENGQSPAPFTLICADDVRDGRWQPITEPEWTLLYLKQLEQQGTYHHTIWPEHCLVGTWGHLVYAPVMDALLEWSSIRERTYKPIVKGLSATTEHYGAFGAQVERPDDPETQVNHRLFHELCRFDIIYMAGEARSHCVAKSLEQLISLAPEIASRVVMIEDCTSSVPGFEALAESSYEKAYRLGVRFCQSSDLR